MGKEVFREEALEEQYSKEQFNRLLGVVGVRLWVILLSLGLMGTVLVLWLFFGQIPVTAKGLGLFYTPENVVAVQSPSRAIVSQISVVTGESVSKGSGVALLNNPSLTLEAESLQVKVQHLDHLIATDKQASNEGIELLLRYHQLVLNPLLLCGS